MLGQNCSCESPPGCIGCAGTSEVAPGEQLIDPPEFLAAYIGGCDCSFR